MPLNVREKSGSDFKKVPEGTHIAVCNMVVDLGLQPSPYGPKHRIFFRWEIPDERTEWEKDGQTMEGPMTIGTTLSASLSKKATLRGFLESWRGKQFTKEELEGFDVFAVLGKSCQLQVIHEKADNGNVYANIKGCMSLPRDSAHRRPRIHSCVTRRTNRAITTSCRSGCARKSTTR